MSYSKIINPKTGRLVKTSSKLGKNIILSYIDTINKSGGSVMEWPGDSVHNPTPAVAYMDHRGVAKWRPDIVTPEPYGWNSGPALFVDADGVVSEEDPYIPSPEELTKMNEEAWESSRVDAPRDRGSDKDHAVSKPIVMSNNPRPTEEELTGWAAMDKIYEDSLEDEALSEAMDSHRFDDHGRDRTQAENRENPNQKQMKAARAARINKKEQQKKATKARKQGKNNRNHKKY